MPAWLSEFVVLFLKLGWASLFAGLLLIGLILSKMIWPDAAAIYRYDALFAYAVTLQILFFGSDWKPLMRRG